MLPRRHTGWALRLSYIGSIVAPVLECCRQLQAVGKAGFCILRVALTEPRMGVRAAVASQDTAEGMLRSRMRLTPVAVLFAACLHRALPNASIGCRNWASELEAAMGAECCLLRMPSAQRCFSAPAWSCLLYGVPMGGLAWPEAGFLCGEESCIAYATA